MQRGAERLAFLVTIHIDIRGIEPVDAAIGLLAVVGVGNHHPLAQQAGGRFIAMHQPLVTHDLVVEAKIHEVQDGVLDAANVLVYRKPVIHAIIHHGIRPGAGVTMHVPGRLHEGIKRVRFALGGATATGAGGFAPVRVCLDGRANAHEFDILGQQDRQLVLRNGHRAAIRAINDRYRAAPIALPADAPVTQAKIDFALAHALLFKPRGRGLFGLGDLHAVQPVAVDGRAVLDPGLAFPALGRLHRANDRQVMNHGKIPVALVLAGNSHDGARAITHQDIVGEIQRDRFFRKRIEQVSAREHATFFQRAALRHPIFLAGRGGLVHKRGDGRSLLRGGDSGNQFMLRSQYGIGHAERRVRASREDPHAQPVRVRGAMLVTNLHFEFAALGPANPVTLHDLDRVGPTLERVELAEQFLGIVRDFQKPLGNRLALHHGTGTPAPAVHDLLIGQNGLVNRIPVDLRVFSVGHALLHQPGEHQLLPAVIVGLAGGDLSRPVVSKPHAVELRAHMFDVLVGPAGGRRPVLDGRVLGRQAKSVPTHGLQDILAQHSMVAADDVTNRVIAHMAHVQRT